MIWLAVIWLIFALIFFALGYSHWKMVGKSISHVQVSSRPMNEMSGIRGKVTILGSDIDQPIKDFVVEFNKYVDSYNQTSSGVNKLQAIGYWVACSTAVLSCVITVLS